MKITYFRLSGYIKILNGMGLDEIIIPFKNFNNRIILVQGENGTGKSTILENLTPNPDSSDQYRTDVLIDQFGNMQTIEYPAEKEIRYEEIDEFGSLNEYRILIQSLVDDSKTRRTTKAYISKNGEEMNPNGNVASFKEVRDSLLGIDPIYLDLSSITSENRGIVDMIPSERRKYMASYIGSLDTYNNIFKTLSKKVSNMKSYMNTLNQKIYEIGNENELRLNQAQMESTLTELNTRRDNVLKQLSEAETTVKIIDPDNKIQDLYVSISERLDTIVREISKNEAKYASLSRDNNIHIENGKFDEALATYTDQVQFYDNLINEINTAIAVSLSTKESLSNRLDEDNARLLSLSTDQIQDNIESAVENLRSEIKTYEEYVPEELYETFKKVSLDSLKELRSSLSDFTRDILAAEELGDNGVFYSAVSVSGSTDGEKKILSGLDNLTTELNELNIKTVELDQERDKVDEIIKSLNEFNNTRPKNCKDDSCPYIAKYVELYKNPKTEKDLANIDENIKQTKNRIKHLKESISINEIIIEMMKRINSALGSISAKRLTIDSIQSLKFLNDLPVVLDRIKNHNRFPEFEIVDQFIEVYSVYEELKSAKEQLKDLESDYKIYTANKSMINSLKESIETTQTKISELEDSIIKKQKELSATVDLNNLLKNKVNTIIEMQELSGTIENLKKDKESLKEEFNSVKDNIKIVKEKVDIVNNLKNELAKIDDTISPLSDSITQIKFNLTNIVSYQNEYQELSSEYDKIVFVRNACSPGNGMGIQSEYIKRYMNDIIIECNRMLREMFGGFIQLDVPVINEKQFSIPFMGPSGLIVPDISNGSTAQKCMMGLVFSCVAMMKSSTKYNIPRFDEIDGGLDHDNRVAFIGVLNSILDIMGSEQCIICSHNDEFDSNNTTRILTSRQGIRFEQ